MTEQQTVQRLSTHLSKICIFPTTQAILATQKYAFADIRNGPHVTAGSLPTLKCSQHVSNEILHSSIDTSAIPLYLLERF